MTTQPTQPALGLGGPGPLVTPITDERLSGQAVCRACGVPVGLAAGHIATGGAACCLDCDTLTVEQRNSIRAAGRLGPLWTRCVWCGHNMTVEVPPVQPGQAENTYCAQCGAIVSTRWAAVESEEGDDAPAT